MTLKELDKMYKRMIIDSIKEDIEQSDRFFKVVNNKCENPGNTVKFPKHDDCEHEYINVGFTSEKFVCKHCDKEKE